MLRSQNTNEDNYISRAISNLEASPVDNEIKALTDDIKQLVTRLGNLLTNKERNKITKELHDILKRVNNTNRNTRLRKNQKERKLLKLFNQHNFFSKKERYMSDDYADLQYQGINDLSNLFYLISIDS